MAKGEPSGPPRPETLEPLLWPLLWPFRADGDFEVVADSRAPAEVSRVSRMAARFSAEMASSAASLVFERERYRRSRRK